MCDLFNVTGALPGDIVHAWKIVPESINSQVTGTTIEYVDKIDKTAVVFSRCENYIALLLTDLNIVSCKMFPNRRGTGSTGYDQKMDTCVVDG